MMIDLVPDDNDQIRWSDHQTVETSHHHTTQQQRTHTQKRSHTGTRKTLSFKNSNKGPSLVLILTIFKASFEFSGVNTDP
jgi:hypothetical protein